MFFEFTFPQDLLISSSSGGWDSGQSGGILTGDK